MKKILKFLILTILLIIAIMCISVFIQTKINPNKIPSIFGYKPFIVLSGSMETELYKGDLVIVRNVNENTLKERDIIAFREDDKYVVTHRIVSIIDNNGKMEFITKGDNNNSNDKGYVKFEDIEGKYVGRIKGLGNLLLVLQKPVTLFITLALIVVFGTLWILIDNNKLSSSERRELEQLRKEKIKKNN